MRSTTQAVTNVFRAVSRARVPILTIAAAYAISISVGIIMVQSGSTFALNYRDKLVGDAVKRDPAAIASLHRDNLRAAMLDFAGNLIVGSVPKTMMAMGIIFPYPFVAYQGWVGGIVSVRGDHTSRLNDFHPAVYYLLTLILQIMAYSLTVGVGVNVGISLFKPPLYYQGEKLFHLFPKEALRDLLRIYALATPLFFVASLWEFLSLWNI
jgi:hypothetical protein